MAGHDLKTRLMATVLPFAFLAASPVYAQTTPSAEPDDSASVDDVIVTGLRGRPRTVLDSPVPVDVFSADTLEDVAQTDTLNTLQTLIPSFTVSRASNTTSNTFVRSPSLRGLSADKTLLLLNSRRRHKSASVGVDGTGSQAADASVIPSIALQSIEVLRDGAAAQYGSDAIAGVINFLLKEDDHGGSFVVQGGQYYEGDGEDILIAGNIGLPLFDNGFVNLSAQYTMGQRTIRANQFTATAFDAVAFAAANPAYAAAVDLSEPLERTGKPAEEAIRFTINSGYQLSDDSELYAYGNYSKSDGSAAANYRYPGGGHVVLDNPIRLQDGSVFRFKDIYPGGLRPLFSGEVTDWSAAGGYRTSKAFANGHTFDMDVGARYGWDKIAYSIEGTLNPSMGPTSPQDFTASNYVSDEFALNADFAYGVPVGWTASPLLFSFGAEYRIEGFEIRAGEENSYLAGAWSAPDPFDYCTNETSVAARTLRASAPVGMGINCALASDPIYNTLSVGSNGITGLAPSSAGEFESSSYSLYGDLSTDITDKWFLNVAVRFEDYEEFGSKTIGKIATRYELFDGFALRASAGTGFRAPTAGQLNMTQVAIQTIDGIPTNVGLYPASNPVSQFLGAQALQPEESVNYSVGFTFSPFSGAALTVDAYQIEVTDQLYSTAQITVTPAVRAAMIAAGVSGADSISSVNFFQNAFDSTVAGIDVVGSYRHLWSDGQSTGLVGSFNYNDYKIDEVQIANLFNARSIFNFENNRPDWRAAITVTHEKGPVSFMVRGNVYGPYARQSTTAAQGFPIQEYDPELQIDAEVTWKVNDAYALSVGARNLFDGYPDPNLINQTNGRIYGDGPVDWQGGFYYAKIAYGF